MLDWTFWDGEGREWRREEERGTEGERRVGRGGEGKGHMLRDTTRPQMHYNSVIRS